MRKAEHQHGIRNIISFLPLASSTGHNTSLAPGRWYHSLTRQLWIIWIQEWQKYFCWQKYDELSGGRLNIKTPSYQYRDSHVKDKTVSPTVLSLTRESPYLGKTVFILRQGPGAAYMATPKQNITKPRSYLMGCIIFHLYLRVVHFITPW